MRCHVIARRAQPIHARAPRAPFPLSPAVRGGGGGGGRGRAADAPSHWPPGVTRGRGREARRRETLPRTSLRGAAALLTPPCGGAPGDDVEPARRGCSRSGGLCGATRRRRSGGCGGCMRRRSASGGGRRSCGGRWRTLSGCCCAATARGGNPKASAPACRPCRCAGNATGRMRGGGEAAGGCVHAMRGEL